VLDAELRGPGPGRTSGDLGGSLDHAGMILEVEPIAAQRYRVWSKEWTFPGAGALDWGAESELTAD
jgi:hypothetical protein